MRTEQQKIDDIERRKKEMITRLTKNYRSEQRIMFVTSIDNIPKYVENVFKSVEITTRDQERFNF